MIYHFRYDEIPYTSIIADVVQRDGPPTEDNFPFMGLNKVLLAKVKNKHPSEAIRLILERDDFDFSHIGEKQRSEGYDPPMRLEDVDPSVVEKYIEMAMYAATAYKDALPAYRRENLQQQVSYKDDETGELFFEYERLISEHTDYSESEYNEWVRRLPYLVHRMYRKSNETGVHIMSVIIAAQKALALGENIAPATLLNKRVYYQPQPHGEFKRIVEPSGRFQGDVQYWAKDVPSYVDTYTVDKNELLSICNRIGVDLTLEDPRKYTPEFMTSLSKNYIVSNTEAFVEAARGANKSLSPRLLAMIGSMSLDDLIDLDGNLGEMEVATNTPTLADAIAVTVKLFKEAFEKLEGNRNPYAGGVTKAEVANLMVEYNSATGRLLQFSHVYADSDGFFRESNGNYLVLNVLSTVQRGGYGPNALFHSCGYLVTYSPNARLQSFAFRRLDDFVDDLRLINSTTTLVLGAGWSVYPETRL